MASRGGGSLNRQVAPIAIDFSTLDHLEPAAGQYRYAVDLVHGLAALRRDTEFLLIGSRLDPVPELADVLGKEDSNWDYIRFQHSTGRASYWRDQLRYTHLLRKTGAALFHSLHGLILMFAPCPIVITQYDLMAELFDDYEPERRSRPYRINKWAAPRLAERIIAISQTTASDLQRLWRVDPQRIDVVPLGTNFNALYESHDRSRRIESSGTLTLLSPYNLEPRKNLATLLKALALVRLEHPNVRLMLFGRAAVTPERERNFEVTVAELNLSTAVERTGCLADTELAWFYRSADVFVFPSFYEGFGLPVLEAMASGACVIARSASAMAEVAGDAAVLVETGDVNELARSISSLLADPQRRTHLRDAARHRASLFSNERMAALTLQSYRAAFKSGARQPGRRDAEVEA